MLNFKANFRVINEKIGRILRISGVDVLGDTAQTQTKRGRQSLRTRQLLELSSPLHRNKISDDAVLIDSVQFQTIKGLLLRWLLRLTNLLKTFQSLSFSLGKIIMPLTNNRKISAHEAALINKVAFKKNSDARVAANKIGTILFTKLLPINSLRLLLKKLIIPQRLAQVRNFVKDGVFTLRMDSTQFLVIYRYGYAKF